MLSTIVNIASIISSLAVLISLVYLSQQIRQAARNQRAVMNRGRSQQVGDWLQFIADAEIAQIVVRGHAGDSSMSALECQRYLWCMYPLFLHFEDSFFQHRDGMIGPEQYESILGHLRSQSTARGFRALWSLIRSRFPQDFADFVDGIMRETTVSDAKHADWIAQWKSAQES